MKRRFFSPLKGPCENAFDTECIRNWPVSDTCTCRSTMNDTPDAPAASACGTGDCKGRFGFASLLSAGAGNRESLAAVPR